MPLKKVLNIKQESFKALDRLKLITLRDLVFYRPHSFIIKDLTPNLSQLHDGQLIQTEIIVQDIKLPFHKCGPIKIIATNESGSILLVFFNKISPMIFSKLQIKNKLIITGKVQFCNYYFQITHPEFIFKKELAESAFEPQYSLTYGLSNKQLYSYILQILQIIEQKVVNSITQSYVREYIRSLFKDLCNIHLYKCTMLPHQISQTWKQSIKNLAAKELFANQASLINIRKLKKVKVGKSYNKAHKLQQSVLSKLNFTLTSAQEDVIVEIEKDQKSNIQMMRLLQGDVGAGKTLVALLTLLNVVADGSQAVLMAPTDLLANQHYQFFNKALGETEIVLALLTGKTFLNKRELLYQKLKDGKIMLLIGTHALFQEKVNFKDLGYIVIDEQHKFGVEQRLQLINKASRPDVLIMTATPIPRSLKLTMFGDMAYSKLKYKPNNRLPIITTSVSSNKTDEVIGSLNKRMLEGEKIYWVCPFIDQNDEYLNEGDKNVYSDVSSRFKSINKIYPNIVGIIHSKMKGNQKDAIMKKFKFGEIKILVATTVIEVGIDVPEATLIVIENAEKFGLAQLHQLRGRVGRSRYQSYCIMIYNQLRLSKNGRQRLEIMRTSNDGFYIAEQDMLLRGSGEILGTRQSGEPQFFFADLSQGLELLEKANIQTMNVENSEFINFQINLFAKTSKNLVKSG